MRILITRPVDESQRTAARLRELGHEALIAPVLHIEPVFDAALGKGPWGAVLMTSGNAARALTTHRRRAELTQLPLFAVGKQTAAAARRAGFTDITSADGDSRDLLRVVSGRRPLCRQPLLYLAGSDIARDLAGELSEHGLMVETVVIYRASAADAFAQDVQAQLRSGAIGGALHYSRRSAAIFVACAKAGGLLEEVRALTHWCLSERSAEPLRQIGAPRIHVAGRPEESALIDLLLRA